MGAAISAAFAELSVGIVFAGVIGVGFALYRHSRNCKQAYDRLYDMARQTQVSVARIEGKLGISEDD